MIPEFPLVEIRKLTGSTIVDWPDCEYADKADNVLHEKNDYENRRVANNQI